MPIAQCTEKTIITDETTMIQSVFKGRNISQSEVKIDHKPTKTNETEVITRTADKPSDKNNHIKSTALSVFKKGIECISGAALGVAGSAIGALLLGPIGGLIGGIVGSAAGEIIGDSIGKKITEA